MNRSSTSSSCGAKARSSSIRWCTALDSGGTGMGEHTSVDRWLVIVPSLSRSGGLDVDHADGHAETLFAAAGPASWREERERKRPNLRGQGNPGCVFCGDLDAHGLACLG